MKVYFISGLAADRRVFKYIRLPSRFEPEYIDWISPKPGEPLKDYSLRIGSVINKNEPFILVGLSLGGMIATEIARQNPPVKLVLISSIPVSADLPFYFRAIGKLGLHKVVPVSFLKSASIIKRFFSAEATADKNYLRQAIRESDPVFVRWAVNAILNWKATEPVECVHIHGTQDLLLPCKYTKPTHFIKGAGHMMILTRGREINHILQEILK